jgi:DNA modification methylase
MAKQKNIEGGLGGTLQIERRSIAELSNDPANARKHNDKNIEAIIASLRRFGQQKPIVIDRNNIVRAGNGTLEAARRLGWDSIDCVNTSLEGSDAIAYAIADNRTAELAEWDDDVLAAQLNGLLTESEEIALAAGWTAEEIEAMVALSEDDPEITEDDVPEPPVDPITKSGDLWILGEHRLLCGDSTKADDVSKLMGGAKADLCFTSPPYGQQRDYTKEGKEKCQDWDGLMQGVFANLPMSESGQVLVNLGLIHREGEWMPYWDGWIEWMRSQGWRRFGWYVWDQGSGLPGDWNGRFAPSHEFIWNFNKTSCRPEKTVATKDATRARKGQSVPIGFRKEGGSAACTSPDSIGQDFKIPDSVVRINRSPVDGKLHPATFPVALPSFAMQCWPGDVYEPFCGSGTTLIAAQQLNRKCYGMEISPQYCDVIVKRWETLTGNKAVLEQ